MAPLGFDDGTSVREDMILFTDTKLVRREGVIKVKLRVSCCIYGLEIIVISSDCAARAAALTLFLTILASCETCLGVDTVAAFFEYAQSSKIASFVALSSR